MAPLDNLTANSSRMEQVHFFLKNGRGHISLTAQTRANVVRAAKRFFLKGETMFYRFDDQASPRVALETRSEVEAALKECHDDAGSGGHRGVTITLRKLEMSYYWKTMTADVRNWVKECPQCQHSHKLLTRAPELHPIQTDGAWDAVGIDLMGPYAETTAGNKYIFTATDLFTKFVFARPVKGKSAGDVASVIVEMFYAYGRPRRVITDRGGEFVNELNDVILKAFDVRHSITSTYHPACSGQDERTNRSISAVMSKYTNEKKTDWDSQITHAAYSMNTSYQASIKLTPYKALFKRDPTMAGTLNNLPEPGEGSDNREGSLPNMEHLLEGAKQLDDKIAANIAQSQDKQKRAYARKMLKGAKKYNAKVGDRVLRRNMVKITRKGGKLELECENSRS